MLVTDSKYLGRARGFGCVLLNIFNFSCMNNMALRKQNMDTEGRIMWNYR